VGLRAVQSTLAQRRTALIITPEIVAAKKLAESVKRLTRHHVALIYSGLSTAERDEAWRRIRSGAVSVVVGTRSAVFSPLGSIGLIWVEDEENSSLKEEAEPRYHARDVACIRARQHGAVLLLGSAHPSVQTFHSFHEPHADQAKPVEADPRIIRLDRGAAPSIELVDLRLMPAGTLLSEALAARIEDSIENRTGSILFMNRKGFAPALQCRACGNSTTAVWRFRFLTRVRRA
jgi:primosomal protein N' (replication factor Y)